MLFPLYLERNVLKRPRHMSPVKCREGTAVKKPVDKDDDLV